MPNASFSSNQILKSQGHGSAFHDRYLPAIWSSQFGCQPQGASCPLGTPNTQNRQSWSNVWQFVPNFSGCPVLKIVVSTPQTKLYSYKPSEVVVFKAIKEKRTLRELDGDHNQGQCLRAGRWRWGKQSSSSSGQRPLGRWKKGPRLRV